MSIIDGLRPTNRQLALWREHGPLLLILALFALICGLYSATVPLGEPPDELAHYEYVRYLDAVGHPPLTAQDRADSGYKGHEPPLYYLTVHTLTRFLHVAQRPMLPLINPDLFPRHSIGDEALLWNSVLHTEEEVFPWHGTSLAWHALRLLSIPLGMVTILCVYAVVRTLFPRQRMLAIAAAGITAFIPQFVYISSVMNNDNLAVPLSVAALWVLVHMGKGDLRWRWFILLGLLVGLARITKFYTLILLPIIAVALLLIAWRQKRWGRAALGGVLVLALTLAIAAPWIIAVQPDNPAIAPKGAVGFAAKMMDIVHTDRVLRSKGMTGAGGGLSAFPAMALSFFRLEPSRWATLLFKSFWAYYGPMTLEASPLLYRAMLAIVALAGLGLLRLCLLGLRRLSLFSGRGESQALAQPLPLGEGLGLSILALQAMAFLLLEALFYTIMRRLPDTAQGRHLYSALPAWALGLAAGLLAWLPSRGQKVVAPVLIGGLLGLCLYALPAWAVGAYNPPLPARLSLISAWQPEAPDAAGSAAAPGIRYLGHSPARLLCRAGESADLTLLWQSTTPSDAEYLLRVDIKDAQGRAYLLHLAQPLGGRLPTRAWDEGTFLRDQYALSVPQALSAGEYPLRITWVTEDLQPVGPALDAGVLEIQSPIDPVAAPAARVDGASSGVAGYRAALSVTASGTDAAPRFVADDGSVWNPVATETYGQGTDQAERAFFLVTGQVRPGKYLPALREGLPAWTADPITVVGRARQFAAPADLTPVGANLGDEITLVGYRLGGVSWEEAPRSGLASPSAVAQPGQAVDVILVWQAQRWIPKNYTVFVHLLDADGTLRAQQDQIPLFDYSTLFWVPGEIVVDWVQLALPADIPSGAYQIELGMYERLDDTRLPVLGANGARDTRVLLPPLLVPER